MDDGWMTANPAKPVKNTKVKSSENAKERIPFSDGEIRRLGKRNFLSLVQAFFDRLAHRISHVRHFAVCW